MITSSSITMFSAALIMQYGRMPTRLPIDNVGAGLSHAWVSTDSHVPCRTSECEPSDICCGPKTHAGLCKIAPSPKWLKRLRQYGDVTRERKTTRFIGCRTRSRTASNYAVERDTAPLRK